MSSLILPRQEFPLPTRKSSRTNAIGRSRFCYFVMVTGTPSSQALGDAVKLNTQKSLKLQKQL